MGSFDFISYWFYIENSFPPDRQVSNRYLKYLFYSPWPSFFHTSPSPRLPSDSTETKAPSVSTMCWIWYVASFSIHHTMQVFRALGKGCCIQQIRGSALPISGHPSERKADIGHFSLSWRQSLHLSCNPKSVPYLPDFDPEHSWVAMAHASILPRSSIKIWWSQHDEEEEDSS